MKLKYYLRGLGIGIIISVLILSLSGSTARMSDSEVIKRAEELGYTKSNENSDKIKDHMNENSSSAPEESSAAPEEQTSVEQPAEPSSAEPATVEPAPEPATTTTSDTSITITIADGEYSDVIASRLAAAGAVSDADDFNKYLISKGYDRLIYKGQCIIPPGADYEQIAQILISKDK
ncbi:MAG: endolytic transglycosylase MltG [Lachnospiraceae bacterium]|nr:endolytic transglycosylase MltG [Lachnospiraceae bacterium]